MIKAEIKGNISFPNEFITQGDLMDVAERLFIPMMQQGIDNREAIDGGSLPPLSKVTIRIKGHDRPLIETGELRRSFYAIPQGKNVVKVSLTGDRYDVGRSLQIEGVRSGLGRKFFRFFGINPRMEQTAVNYMKAKVAEVIKKFNGK
jgi:hypothetical protein